MDTELACVPQACTDPLRLGRVELDWDDPRPAWIRPERRVDDRLAPRELGEGVGSNPELADPAGGAASGMLCAVAGGLVCRLPKRSRSHELGEPVSRLGSGLAMGDDAGEVVGQARQEAGLTGERLWVSDRLRYDDHLPAVAPASLEDRDGAAGGHLDHRPELVEH